MKLSKKRSYMWKYFEDTSMDTMNSARCKLCGKTMKKNHTRHLRAIHPSAYKKVMRSRRYDESFKKYMNKVGVRLYQCDICNKKFKVTSENYYFIRNHIQSVHPYVYAKETSDLNEDSDTSEKEKSKIVIKKNANVTKMPKAKVKLRKLLVSLEDDIAKDIDYEEDYYILEEASPFDLT